jgi:biopolymer transport protein ExbD
MKAFILLAAFVLSTAHQPTTQVCDTIKYAPAKLDSLRNNIVLAFDDSGRVNINNQPIQHQELNSELRAIYAPRPINSRILFVRCGPSSDDRVVTEVLNISKHLDITLYRTHRSADI